MSAIVLGQRVSKAQRLSNWEAGKLTPQQQMYAATDAWICIKIYDKLMATEPIIQIPTEETSAIQPKPQPKIATTEKVRNEAAKGEDKTAKPKRRFRPKRKEKSNISNKL
jgi:ribonuclease D